MAVGPTLMSVPPQIPSVKPLADKPLESRSDFQAAVVNLFDPLRDYFSPGKARVNPGETGATFPDVAGFEAGVSITAGIGYAMFDMAGQSPLVTEGFLVSFILIAVALDAALDGALLLARREDGSVLDRVREGGEK